MSLFSSSSLTKDDDEKTLLEKASEGFNLPTGKLGRAIAVYHLGNTAYNSARGAYKKVEDFRTLSIYIDDNDPMYQTVVDWLTKKGLKDTSKEVNLSSRREFNDLVGELGASSLKASFTTSKKQRITIRGFKVWVFIDSNSNAAALDQRAARAAGRIANKVIFTMTNRAAHAAVLEELSSLHEDYSRKVNPPRLFSPSSYGGFETVESVPMRSLDSVVLKDGELDFLTKDIAEFLSEEERYIKLGIPWHRGYLFHGEVGTGKTSIAKAIANHFGLNVYYLPLGDLGKDGELTSLLRSISPRSMLLLEDIDVFSAATARDAEHDELSLSGLLNALDGLTTPHGMITVMTTNEIDKLDRALIRPGRVDVKQEFTALDEDQGRRLYKHFYNALPPEDVSFKGFAPSSVVGVFKQHLDDPKTALTYIKELVK